MYPISRLAWGVILSIVVITLAFALTDNHPNEAPSEPLACASEDEVPVIIAEDSYSLHEGELHCVHYDVLGGTR